MSKPLEFNAKAQRSKGAKWETDFSSGKTNHRLVTVRNCALAPNAIGAGRQIPCVFALKFLMNDYVH